MELMPNVKRVLLHNTYLIYQIANEKLVMIDFVSFLFSV